MTTLEQIRKQVEQLNREVGQPTRLDLVKGTTLANARRWVNAIRQGRVFFYDKDAIKVGLRNIDWSGAHVKHQEWPAQLNRFFWLSQLAALYRVTGEKDLPALARRTIEDWMDGHEPYTAGKPPAKGDNTLNISIRLGQAGGGGWWNAVASFCGTPDFDETFVRRMIESTRGQVECLKAHLAPTINWRISHLNCILFCGMVLPGFDEYREYAARLLNETFWRQVDPDGSHEERCPSSYHQWMMRLFTSLVYLGQARPKLGLRIDPARVGRMWDYALYSTTPDGGSSGMHDGGVWTPTRPFRTLAEERKRYLKAAGLKGEQWAVERKPSRFFPDAGHLFLRDSWKPGATYASVDAVRYGGGHCHMSKLAVNLYSGKRMLLYDPGVFTYEDSDPFMAYGKSTMAHNTATLRNYNQAEANPDVYEVHILKNYAVFCGAYAGSYFSGPMYWGFKHGLGKAEYGAHERVVLWVGGEYLVVFDLVKADHMKEVPYQVHWQFPAGKAVLDSRKGAAWTTGADDNVYVRSVLSSGPVRCSLHRGEKKPILGWLPTGHGVEFTPAPHCVMEGVVGRGYVKGGGYAKHVTLVVPFKGNRPPVVGIRDLAPGSAQQALEFSFKDGTRDIVIAMPTLHRMIGDCGPVSTDGTLAVIRLKHGKPVSTLLNSGSWLEYNGKPLICSQSHGTYEV